LPILLPTLFVLLLALATGIESIIKPVYTVIEPHIPRQESLADYAERRTAAMEIAYLRRQYGTQALP
jgi:hypothetical protein